MARTCEICERGTTTTATRSHSNIQTKRKSFVNLQSKKIDGKRMQICTRCLKTKFKKES